MSKINPTELEVQAMTEPCEMCNEPAGAWCRSAGRRIAKDLHSIRRERAFAARWGVRSGVA